MKWNDGTTVIRFKVLALGCQYLITLGLSYPVMPGCSLATVRTQLPECSAPLILGNLPLVLSRGQPITMEGKEG